jgi:tetratricopeptide (TPR) repeat protein
LVTASLLGAAGVLPTLATAEDDVAASTAGTLTLSTPGLPWALEIALPGFVLTQKEVAAGGRAARLQASNRKTGVTVSAFLEPARGTGGTQQCRDYYWSRARRSPFPKEGIRIYESEPFSVVEYTIVLAGKQQNINAYLAEAGYWIDVHFSQSAERVSNKPLVSLLKSVRIIRPYTPTALDHFAYGNAYYQQEDYRQAAQHFEKALASDAKASTLDRRAWKRLVVRLGVSYGIDGDVEQAKKLFQEAIRKTPDYPMFYYNLACAFAEQNDRDQALRNLRLAYQHKGHMLDDESLPDPKRDSSFRKYLSDPKFWEELSGPK